eukprot:TRINITY_DN5295_c0_g1_i1.p2 TRINITY_DN5295_c0_g1~~TRINITY_DN5295_c0_g1_i1.p2  ORF type:complete len:235 (+),score=87.40 TRINITY_DN5295_c0_g1_i1:39-707(+)
MSTTSFPTLKYSYFDFVGWRAEPARVFMVLHDIPFEDDRVVFADWPAMKNDPTKAPFGSLPVLSVDGKLLTQTSAQLAYLSQLVGGQKDLFKEAKANELVAVFEDISARLFKSGEEGIDKDVKMALRKTLAEETFPKWLKRLETALSVAFEGREAGGLLFGGDKPSQADIRIAFFYRYLKSGALDHIPTSVVDGYPYFQGIYDTVFKHPKVVEHMAKFNAKF